VKQMGKERVRGGLDKKEKKTRYLISTRLTTQDFSTETLLVKKKGEIAQMNITVSSRISTRGEKGFEKKRFRRWGIPLDRTGTGNNVKNR